MLSSAWQPQDHDGDEQPFTVGFAGRLVEEKGLMDLVEAVRNLPGARLRLVGNGPLAQRLATTHLPDGVIEVITDLPHERMAEAYATFDVLVFPIANHPTLG